MIWGGTSGGPCPVQRSADGAILFSYGGNVLEQNIAVNKALEGTGVQVRGYQYGWTIKNANAGSVQFPEYDPFIITIRQYDSTNKNIVEQKHYDYSKRINDWTRFSGTEDYRQKYSLASMGNLSVSMSSRDSGYWAGYYGPEINNIDVRLRYSVDICGANPLSSPTCEGYEQAYFNQQCSLNPLYNTACPGFGTAYLNQQCSVNPLFSNQCPGYQAAYLTQQCNSSQLYSPQCPGYEAAYLTQQCNANQLYNTKCPGYEAAYFTQQCNLNPLYNSKCTGYGSAYLSQQCGISQLYSNQCPGYQQAYLTQQCNITQLFSNQCPGYQAAYLTQQCNVSALYSPQCPGYEIAYRNKLAADACSANPQSSPSCKGYQAIKVVVESAVTTITNSDPVKELVSTKIVSDPIVNQALASNAETKPQASQSVQSTQTLTSMSQPQPRQQRQSSQQQTARQEIRTAVVQRAVTTAQKTEEQKKQDDAISSMSNVPGFSSYTTAVIPDVQFYKFEDIYRRVTMNDNMRAQRALSQRSDRIHREMVNEQYRN